MSDQKSVLLTLLFIMSWTRSDMDWPAFGLTRMYRALTSGHERRSFSTSTFPMKPVAPVISTFFPAYHSEIETMMSMTDERRSSWTLETIYQSKHVMLIKKRYYCLTDFSLKGGHAANRKNTVNWLYSSDIYTLIMCAQIKTN